MTSKFQKIKVGIAEDHALLRSALIGLINEHDLFEVVVDGGNGLLLLENLVEATFPDVLLVDVEMPELDGPSTVTEIRNIYGDDVVILGLSVHKETRLVSEMIDNGANGFITKGASSDELFEGMRKALHAGFYLSKDIAQYFNGKNLIHPYGIKLNENEEVIIRLICEEKTNEEIADILCLTRNTINTYRTRLIEKLKVKNSVGLVIYALKNGLFRVE